MQALPEMIYYLRTRTFAWQETLKDTNIEEPKQKLGTLIGSYKDFERL